MQELRKNPVVNLSRGLVTEQSPLNPVDNSTTDELNMDIALDGTRRSRKGLAYLHNRSEDHPSKDVPQLTHTLVDDGYWNTYVWSNPGDYEGLSFLVCQYVENQSGVDTTELVFVPINRFFNSGTASSSGLITTTLSSSSASRLDFTESRGKLIVTGPDIETAYLSVVITTSGSSPYFSVVSGASTPALLTRDFSIIGTKSATAIRSTTDETKYDSVNAGWNATAITAWQTGDSSSDQPPLSSRWFSDKNSSGAFDYSLWNARQKGSNFVSAGSAIISICQDGVNNNTNLVSRRDWMNAEHPTLAPAADNDFLTENPGLDTGKERLAFCEAFAGRVFYAGHSHQSLHNKVFFSQVVEDSGQEFFCYQKNDPTSDGISDLLDSDGGFINIEHMSGCTGIKVFSDSLIVFGNNGVWAVRGNGNGAGFSATDYRVEKISEEGVPSNLSAIVAEDTLFYLNKFGVNTVSRDANNVLVHNNISRPVIQKYWKDNYSSLTVDCRGVYDPLNRQVQWLFSSTQDSVRDKVLVFDLNNQAFLPWAFDPSLKVRGAFYYTSDTIDDATQFSDYSKANILRGQELPRVMYIVKDVGTLPDGSKIQTSGASDLTQTTWNIADMSAPINVDLKTYVTGDTDVQFNSYLETAPDFFGDMHSTKESKELVVYMEKMKKFHFPFPVNFSSDSVETENRIKVKHSWNFEPFENEQVGYKLYNAEAIATTPAGTVGDADYTFNQDISIKRLKFSGNGQGLKLRFESDGIYPMNLIGYSTVSARNLDYEN